MKLIATGWQYRIYDLGNGRVLKKKYYGIPQYLHIVFHSEDFHISIFKAIKRQRKVNDYALSSHKYIRGILPKIDAVIFGNPTFIDELQYEQDKVRPWHEISYKEEEVYKKLFNKYLKLIYALWEYGCHEVTYNFTINNGIDKNGNLIQLDFGEIVIDKDNVEQLIKERTWLKSYSCINLPKNLRNYYERLMIENITSEKLSEFWKTKII